MENVSCLLVSTSQRDKMFIKNKGTQTYHTIAFIWHNLRIFVSLIWWLHHWLLTVWLHTVDFWFSLSRPFRFCVCKRLRSEKIFCWYIFKYSLRLLCLSSLLSSLMVLILAPFVALDANAGYCNDKSKQNWYWKNARKLGSKDKNPFFCWQILGTLFVTLWIEIHEADNVPKDEYRPFN